MKRLRIILPVIILITVLFAGCGGNDAEVMKTVEDDKLTVVATLFPQYDFAKQIADDGADVSMLLLPGVESHMYEPTPADVAKISEADIFLYTGDLMEPWAKRILDGVDSDVLVIDVSKGIDLTRVAAHDHENNEHGNNEHGADGHIWLDPTLAQVMVSNIAEAFSTADPQNSQKYSENAGNYNKKLDKLDKEIAEVVANGNKDTIVVGGRFALYHFVKRYDLKYESAFASCSAKSESDPATIAHLIDFVRQNDIKVIFDEELSNEPVAESIANETGAKILIFHTAHNLSKDEMDRGVSYLDIMEQNKKNLEEGLS